MTTGPAEKRAVPPDRLRASHADREQVISALKTAFVQGRLVRDELDARVGQALVARTHTELAVITADIPAGPIGVRPTRPAQPTRPVLGVKSGACVTALAALLAATLWAAAAAGSAAAGAAALAVSGVVIFTLFVTGYQVRESRHPGRSA